MTLEGKTAIVTGASRGIGRAIAKKLASEGATVAVGCRTKKSCDQVVTEIKKAGSSAYGILLDVTEDRQVYDAVDQVLATSQKIDILVNCAGITVYDTPTWATTVEQWDEMMKINLRGTFVCCHTVAPHMIHRNSGAIINIGSSSARYADDEMGPYTTSKWAIMGYTTSLARSVRPYGIRVNGINPGWVDTDMSRAYNPNGDPEWTTAEEIADVAMFLLTRAPNDMTGQFIDVFGSTAGP